MARRSPTLGEGRLLVLDGPGGSGKTTLAAAVGSLAGAPAVHADDLYDGWSGLDRVADQLETLLRPLVDGEPGHYRRYDWPAGRFAETVRVDPAPLLVLEGVGTGARAHADLATVLAWVQTPPDLRLARALARDGEEMAPQWAAWRRTEEAHFAAERTRERADVEVDGTRDGRSDGTSDGGLRWRGSRSGRMEP